MDGLVGAASASDNAELIMGRCYTFECPKCGLQARVAGGMDQGLDCFTQTVVCHDCRKLFDAATHVRLPRAANPRPAAASEMHHARLRSSLALDLKLILPDHIHASKVIVSQKPILPVPLLNRSTARWVELALCCPRGTTHRVEKWKDPGRCPRCQAFLDKSFVPYRVWD